MRFAKKKNQRKFYGYKKLIQQKIRKRTKI